MLNEQILRTHLFAVLDDLEFLRRSGRVNDLLAGLGSVLQIKPVFKVYNGRASYDRVRTHKRALKRLIQLLDEQGPLVELCVVHSHALDRAEQLRDRVSHLQPEAAIRLIDVSPIIATHIGPNAVGVVGVVKTGGQ
jgi:DegV family protein with EDD domain